MSSAIIIRTDSQELAVEEIDLNSLDALQAAVGGFIEPLYLNDHKAVMLFNEEGKIKRLPINDTANRTLRALGLSLTPGDFLVGNVLIAGVDGSEFANVPDAFLEACRAAGLHVQEA